MSDYAQTTQFTAKDTLPSGALARRIRGSEHDVELGEIRIAIATKSDEAGSGIDVTGKTASIDIDGLTTEVAVLHDKLAAVDADASNATVEVDVEGIPQAIATGGTTGVTQTSGVLELSFGSVTDATMAAADEILFADVSNADALAKMTSADLPAVLAGEGFQASAGKLALDINSLTTLTSADFDPLNDEFMFYNAAGPNVRKPITTYRNLTSLMWESGLDFGTIETDDILPTDERIFLSATGEITRVKDYHRGAYQVYSLGHFMNIPANAGKVIINETGGGALWAFLASSNYAVGQEFILTNASMSDYVLLYPATGEYMASTKRIGIDAAGAVTIDLGGTAVARKTATSIWHVEGDIS